MRSVLQLRRSYVLFRRLVPQGLIDLIWPTLDFISEEERRKEEEGKGERLKSSLACIDVMTDRKAEELAAALEICKELLRREAEHRQSVESRLTTVLGLASVAAALTFGSLASQAWQGFDPQSSFGARLAGLLGVYIVLQSLAAVFAAVRGLGRRSYLEPCLDDFLPLLGEASEKQAQRCMRELVRCLQDHQTHTAAKVEQMAIAHQAIKNFLRGMLILVLCLTILSFLPAREDSIEEKVILQLRSDPQLIELLRGPKGLQGERGFTGPKGQKGDRGPRGPQGAP